MQNDKYIKVALADDHVLLRNALASLIDGFEGCKVIHQANNGRELIEYFKNGAIPDVVVLDLSMPEMDGYETAKFIQKHFPEVHILMLTMYDSELSLIRLLQAGAKGFLKKDIHPSELKFAIQSVMKAGYYYSNHTTDKLANLFRSGNEKKNPLQNAMLTDQELQFLRLACSDLTYKEIAQKMTLNPRAVDNLRDQLFTKFDVKSRVGLAMVAIKNGVVTF
ncbi:MAG TPA: response regulator transcription factor [Chitinophagaceae bacterium]|jgi:DNA-binding NarL/FixJ family response regulator|nr:response regulator transcription factor [Chitinophagaceae bacterium]